MRVRQQTNHSNLVRRASARERRTAVLIMSGAIVFFAGLWVLQRVGFDFGLLFGPCGFKQRTGLPCPACGMTTAVLAFARGNVLLAFYVQPAAAFLCCILVLVAFLALPTSVFGVYFNILDRLSARLRIRDMVLGLLVVLAAAWAVTLARALATQT